MVTLVIDCLQAFLRTFSIKSHSFNIFLLNVY